MRFSEQALATISICRLPGETDRDTIERLLVTLLPVAEDIETFFGKQIPNTKTQRNDRGMQ